MPTPHPETLALHAGWRRDPATHAVATPIYQTTSCQFDSTERASPGYVRLSIGLEHIDDTIADLSQALDAAA